jgi:hypothetical protein
LAIVDFRPRTRPVRKQRDQRLLPKQAHIHLANGADTPAPRLPSRVTSRETNDHAC